jgi:Mrp family chromosome partitioning ATPase
VAPDPEPPGLVPPRNPAITVRFGYPLPARAVEEPHAAAIVVRDAGGLLEAIFDDPEVEVIGADVDPEGAGAFARMRAASPSALAALRVLRHRLEQRRVDGRSFVVSVVSPGRGEGKTRVAAELAMTLAEADRARVVLVEGNLERPRVAATLGMRLPESAGFSAQVRRHMSGLRRPWGVVHLGPSLAVLAECSAAAAYPAALHSTHFASAVHALRRSYDYVIIDGPAVLGSGDANVIEGVSDGVVLVARAGVTRGAALARAIHQLGERRILGVVLNGG